MSIRTLLAAAAMLPLGGCYYYYGYPYGYAAVPGSATGVERPVNPPPAAAADADAWPPPPPPPYYVYPGPAAYWYPGCCYPAYAPYPYPWIGFDFRFGHFHGRRR